MKINAPSLIAGIFIAVSGSIFASSTTVPFVFTAGQKAKAAEINSNFSTLAEAINKLESRVFNTELTTGRTLEDPIVPADLPIGSTITISGTIFTIKQFEVQSYKDGSTYLVKVPRIENSIPFLFSNATQTGLHDRWCPYNKEVLVSGFKVLYANIHTTILEEGVATAQNYFCAMLFVDQNTVVPLLEYYDDKKLKSLTEIKSYDSDMNTLFSYLVVTKKI